MCQLLFSVLIAIAVGSYSAQLDIAHPIPSDYLSPNYDEEYPPSYVYGYAIEDTQSYNNFHHHETSNAKVTTGSYRVALPDGRTQIVTYRADENGYVADVKYEGEAKYPD